MARDALSSGNTVTAENYFQHAEHYNRIIQAAQLKQEEQANAQSAKTVGARPTGTKSGTGKPTRSNERGPKPQHKADEEVVAKTTEVEVEIPGSGEQPSINGNGAEGEPAVEKPKRKPRARKPKVAKAETSDDKATKDEPDTIVAS